MVCVLISASVRSFAETPDKILLAGTLAGLYQSNFVIRKKAQGFNQKQQ
jgi:hypothetical protein